MEVVALLYEYRVYQAQPGKLDALNARFAQQTLAIFARHGFQVVGFWEPAEGGTNELHYLLAWRDAAQQKQAWAAFRADPDWTRARDESERDGPLLVGIRTQMWRPTEYSPLK